MDIIFYVQLVGIFYGLVFMELFTGIYYGLVFVNCVWKYICNIETILDFELCVQKNNS